MKAWLRKQPKEVAVAFAARAALRGLPIVQRARKGLRGKHDFLGDIVLPVFRATGAAWVVAKYPAQATEFSSAARAAAIAARATLYAAFAARATADAAIAARAAADAAFAARPTADATVFAARAAAAVPGDPITLWSAITIDVARAGEGAAASDIAGSPLWPHERVIPRVFGPDSYLRDRIPDVMLVNEQPDQLQSLWQEMKTTLLAAKQDWEVWTDWYDDRLAGRVRDEEFELAYVRIEEGLWDQGPAKVNAEIKRRIRPGTPEHGVATGP